MANGTATVCVAGSPFDQEEKVLIRAPGYRFVEQAR